MQKAIHKVEVGDLVRSVKFSADHGGVAAREVFMVMEDLDAAGFPLRKNHVSSADIKACLSWLANFHAEFMDETPSNLWETGTYWHLETRPDELQELDDLQLKAAASAIDRKLNESPFQTFVHGDAKLANFCFSNDGKVAAVDFQYIGGGCGMKDVAYFLGSTLSESDQLAHNQDLLEVYLQALKQALNNKVTIKRHSDREINEILQEWRSLYPFACADFHRFLAGWSPDHWKINAELTKQTQLALNALG